jgi:hypothetical protein
MTIILESREGKMKRLRSSFIIALTFAFLLTGCGGPITQLSPSSTPGAEEGAREWIDAIVNQDGNKMLKHTCMAQRENLKKATMWVSAFSILATIYEPVSPN